MSLSLVAQAPATAASSTKPDARGDMMTRLDITSASYTNGPAQVRARMRVPELQGPGQAHFTIGLPDSDISYVASVQRHGDGKTTKRFAWVTNVRSHAKPCSFRAQWQQAKGVVNFEVPHSCLKLFGKYSRLYLAVRTNFGSNVDWAPPVRKLARG